LLGQVAAEPPSVPPVTRHPLSALVSDAEQVHDPDEPREADYQTEANHGQALLHVQRHGISRPGVRVSRARPG
jgi:hypothetical protein